MKKANSNRLSQLARAQLRALDSLPENRIDTSDIPEVTDWTGWRRGVFYRPVKQQITLRLDADIVDWFRRHAARDTGYQTNINQALREHVVRQGRKAR